jgi:hypothetical protein
VTVFARLLSRTSCHQSGCVHSVLLVPSVMKSLEPVVITLLSRCYHFVITLLSRCYHFVTRLIKVGKE